MYLNLSVQSWLSQYCPPELYYYFWKFIVLRNCNKSHCHTSRNLFLNYVIPLSIVFMQKGTEICNYSYPNTILAVRLNRVVSKGLLIKLYFTNYRKCTLWVILLDTTTLFIYVKILVAQINKLKHNLLVAKAIRGMLCKKE